MSSLFARDGDGSPTSENDKAVKVLFNKLKVSCVPLLGQALITPKNTSRALELLESIRQTLSESFGSGTFLTPSIIQYTFFPLSTILQRNQMATLPDQLIEKIFLVLELLCRSWWWSCELAVWEQLVILSASILTTSSSQGGANSRARDDHAKEAVARCLTALCRPRNSAEEDMASLYLPLVDAEERLHAFQSFAITRKFFPVIGQLVSNLLGCSESTHRPLQLVSLELSEILITQYMGASYSPTVLPGVVSSMCKILASKTSRASSWPNSEVAVAALQVLQAVVVHSIADDVCEAAGVLKADIVDISELGSGDLSAGEENPFFIGAADTPSTGEGSSYPPFARSSSWLQATASQLLMAFNSLTPLVQHPSSSVLVAFSAMCSLLLAEASTTLATLHPLFLSNLLTLSVSEYPSVSTPTITGLRSLLTKSPSLAQTLLQMTKSYLITLPRIIPSHSDSKIEAVCILSSVGGSGKTLSHAVESLLGPNGGIEKWGYSLFQVMDFELPPVASITTNDRLLEIISGIPGFTRIELKQVPSHDALESLEPGEAALFSVEWFVERGLGSSRAPNVAALWLAARLLEGIGGTKLGDTAASSSSNPRKKIDKTCRWVVRSIGPLIVGEDKADNDTLTQDPAGQPVPDDRLPVEYRRGFEQLTTLLDIGQNSETSSARLADEKTLHVTLGLHLMAICSSILGSRFRPLLFHSIYPIIHAMVSPTSAVASAAQSTLHIVTHATASTSPALLLLSNFDYALNSVSLHLTRHNLDVQATKVLATLVRLVGSEVVERAGDVVEECFDRLDEFHGYGVVVEGLVAVLGEVVHVLQNDEEMNAPENTNPSDPKGVMAQKQADVQDSKGAQRFDDFLSWFEHRNDPEPDPFGGEPIGPVPQHGWGERKDVGDGEAGNAGLNSESHANSTAGAEDPMTTPPTKMQALTQQIVARSLFFLTHPSPLIRARILALLSSAVPVLRTAESSLLGPVHTAWPFIVNRLSDSEPFVVTEAAGLIEALVINVGEYMNKRVWDEVWPRFKKMLHGLDIADSQSALARTRGTGLGATARTAYSVSHRMYRSLLGAMIGVVRGTQLREDVSWELALACRRFLSTDAHTELRAKAVELYTSLAVSNRELVWFVLASSVAGVVADREKELTVGTPLASLVTVHGQLPYFLQVPQWEIFDSVVAILTSAK
ncbi:hypothetical protein DL93DRAFT_2147716 [Clavulina sp. PMI_390]|nr:hypothetical protein DL93DRAFT_2147716 [Clavulina sp. PMI_390]